MVASDDDASSTEGRALRRSARSNGASARSTRSSFLRSRDSSASSNRSAPSRSASEAPATETSAPPSPEPLAKRGRIKDNSKSSEKTTSINRSLVRVPVTSLAEGSSGTSSARPSRARSAHSETAENEESTTIVSGDQQAVTSKGTNGAAGSTSSLTVGPIGASGPPEQGKLQQQPKEPETATAKASDMPVNASSDVSRQSVLGARSTAQKTVDEAFVGCERDEDGGIKIGDVYIPPPPPPACTFESTGPRLIISRIENSYFKSYGKHVVIGPLHKNFSGIVGPNGSGKSNVIDSMLFVFGYRSKKVRAQKVCNLIHNCDVHPNIPSCTVDVHFETIIDRGDTFDSVPGSHLVIGRTAFKDNSSHYTINGKIVTQKVVTKALREQGIDLDHDRFLILQGEVEQISMMKPKGETENDDGMLEYLEDIVGTNRYKQPIEAFVKNVDGLQEERNAALDRVNMAEQDMLGSRELRDEALRYLRLCNEITLCDQKLCEIARLTENDKKTRIESRINEEQANLDSLKEKMSKFLLDNKKLTEAHKALCREEAEVIKECEGLEAEFMQLEKKDVVCREDRKHASATIKKLEKTRETQVEKIEKLKSDAEKFPSEKAAAEKAAEELTKDVARLEEDLHSRMEGLNKKVLPIQAEKEKLESNLLELQRNVNSAKSAFSMAESNLELLMSSERTERKKLEESERALADARKGCSSSEATLSALKQDIPKLQAEYEKSRNELATLDRMYEEIRNSCYSERVRLEEMRSAYNATRSSNRLLDALMTEKKRGGALKGVVGRLGDLGGIDKEYDVAISNACGLLDAIVVDTTTTATQCIKYLQQNNLGRANFLALSKMEHLIEQAQRPFAAPENAPRLIDLVQLSDPAYLGVFYYALRDTLYVRDIDAATRIGLYGKQRFRVVTFKGEIVDPSGTLTGGGSRPLSGKMGRTAKVDSGINESEMEALAQRVDELERKTADLAAQKDSAERVVPQQKKRLDQANHEFQRVSIELQTFREKSSALEARIEIQRKSVAEHTTDPKKLADLEQQVRSTKEAYDRAVKATETDRLEIEKIDKRIDKIREESIGDVKTKLDVVQKKLKAAEAKKTECQVGLNNSSRKLNQAEQKLADIVSELEATKETSRKAKQAYDELTAMAVEVNEKLAKRKELKEDLSKRVSESARALHEFNKQEGELKSRQVEQANIVKDLEKERDQCCKAIERYVKHVQSLRLEIIDEGEDENAPAPAIDTPVVLPVLSEEQVRALDAGDVETEKVRLSEERKSLKPTLSSINEFKVKMGHYRKLSKVYLDKQQTLDQYKGYLHALKKARLQEFLTGFRIITQKVKEMYRTITLGGDADLELVDSLDPFAEGISFSVRPPRKTWKNISNLSGGEKTLSSLSLVFALHYYKPAPFYVMDEIDAALDHKNVSIIANYINERTKNTQFIIISLREEMFSLARKLTGIYKPYNDTDTITLDVEHCTIGQCAEKENEDPKTINNREIN